jgi:hypothetical protein
MPMSPRLLRPRAAGGDSDVQNYIAAVEAADGQPLEQAVKDAIRDFITGCKTDNIWSAIKASCVLIGARTLSGALTPLVGVAPTNNGPFLSGDYSRKTGLIGDGSTKYLDSNRNNNADPQDSKHLAVYASQRISDTASGVAYFGMSNSNAGGTSSIAALTNQLGLRVNSTSGTNSNYQNENGFIGCSRNLSASFGWRVNAGNGTLSNTSAAPASANLWVLGRFGFSPALARIAFYSIGEHLDLSLLRTRVDTLYASIGAALAPTYADADVNAYINAVEAADGAILETGVRDAINAFITGCKADGIWSAIKASCILMGARTLSGALTPLVGSAPTNVNFVSGDYNRKTGLIGNGSTKYLDSNRNNNADPQDSKHMAVYATALLSSGGPSYIGTNNASGVGNSQIVASTTQLGFRLNQSSSSLNNYTTETGFIGCSRSLAASFGWRVNAGSGTISASTTTPAAGNLWIFNRINDTPSNARIAFYSIGEHLDLSLLRTRVDTLYTAIGAAIP